MSGSLAGFSSVPGFGVAAKTAPTFISRVFALPSLCRPFTPLSSDFLMGIPVPSPSTQAHSGVRLSGVPPRERNSDAFAPRAAGNVMRMSGVILLRRFASNEPAASAYGSFAAIRTAFATSAGVLPLISPSASSNG